MCDINIVWECQRDIPSRSILDWASQVQMPDDAHLEDEIMRARQRQQANKQQILEQRAKEREAEERNRQVELWYAPEKKRLAAEAAWFCRQRKQIEEQRKKEFGW